MTLQQLRCFTVMAEELHYTRAAARLHISQPSLSYSITELEKELGLKLFERKDNRTEITEYGQVLLPMAENVIRRTDEISRRAEEMKDSYTGVIRVGSIYSISYSLLPLILEEFFIDTENIRVNVAVSQAPFVQLIDRMQNGSLDLVLVEEANESSRYKREFITLQEIKLITPAGHPLAGKPDLCLKDLKGVPLVMFDEHRHNRIYTHLMASCRKNGFEPNISASVSDEFAMSACVSAGMGVAIAPVAPSMAKSNVVMTSFSEPDRTALGRRIYLCWSESNYLSPATRRFRNFVIENFRDRQF